MEEDKSLDEIVEENKLSPVEEAAREFTFLNYQFGKLVDNAKGLKSIKRVLKQITEYPLGPQAKPKLRGPQEEMLFDLFQEIMKHKQVIINATVKDIMEKQKLLEEENSNPGESNE